MRSCHVRHPGVRGREAGLLVPDAPVTKFELSMKGGAKGLLENSENICSHTQKALAHFVAQNGKVEDLHPLIANSCKSHKRHRRAHRRHR